MHTPHKSNSDLAADHLVTRVSTAKITDTCGDVLKRLQDPKAYFDTVDYTYVLNDNGNIEGVISIKELLNANDEDPIQRLMTKKCVVAHLHTDQERIAFLALKHSIKAVPIVDKNHRFMGVIPAHAILHIIDKESVENLLRFGGVMHGTKFDDILHMSLAKSLKHRIPWLIVGLVGGILASGIVSRFETLISKNLILAAFIPLIVYISDAVGTQMEAFIIRDLAVDEKIRFFKYFLRHLTVVAIMSVILSTLLYVGGIIFYNNPHIILVISLALFFAIISSLFTGLIIPFIFSKLKLDPANASGPVATIIQDITSVFIYFSIGSLLL